MGSDLRNKEELFWLIEDNAGSIPVYLADLNTDPRAGKRTTNAWEALRFPTKEAAQVARDKYQKTSSVKWAVVQHGFVQAETVEQKAHRKGVATISALIQAHFPTFDYHNIAAMFDELNRDKQQAIAAAEEAAHLAAREQFRKSVKQASEERGDQFAVYFVDEYLPPIPTENLARYTARAADQARLEEANFWNSFIEEHDAYNSLEVRRERIAELEAKVSQP